MSGAEYTCPSISARAPSRERRTMGQTGVACRGELSSFRAASGGMILKVVSPVTSRVRSVRFSVISHIWAVDAVRLSTGLGLCPGRAGKTRTRTREEPDPRIQVIRAPGHARIQVRVSYLGRPGTDHLLAIYHSLFYHNCLPGLHI